MTHSLKRSAVVVCVALVPLATAYAAEKDPIADYQSDLSAGTVSASELLGLSPSVISTIRSPRDFVAAVDALNAGSTKAGFGLSFTPARTSFSPVSIGRYKTNLGARAWAGTSFSYAQNTATFGGIDYKQEAAAVNVTFFLKAQDDPAVASHDGFATCTNLVKLADQRTERLIAIRKELRDQGVSDEDLNDRARAVLAKENDFLTKALPEYKLCVDTAIARAKAKWNASQVSLTYGEARLRNAATGADDLRMGRVASMAIAMAPNEDSLVNLTVKRNDKGLNTATITGAPSYKSSNLAGLRFTYRAMDAKDLYVLAEMSNAKASNVPNDNVFKYALGVDKRIAEGIWVELRLGRKSSATGQAAQNAALMSLKLSPQSSLAR
jgi:hypothetical protein